MQFSAKKRHNKIIICILVGVIVTVYLVFQLLKTNQTISIELETPVVISNGYIGEQTICEDISLRRGIWDVEVFYQTEAEEDMKSVFLIRDLTLPENALCTMGQFSYTGLSSAVFPTYVYRDTHRAELYVTTQGENLTVSKVVFHETNLLWIKYLVSLWFAVVSAAILFIIFGTGSKYTTKQKKVCFILVVISFLASIPFLFQGTISGGDLGYHLHRIEGIASSIKNGIFPVRIEPHWQQGYGYADAIFYCPLFLYIPGIMRTLGFTVSEAYNFYCVLCTFATVFISFYSFGSITDNTRIGVLSSLLYTTSISRIQWLTCGAVGEYTALTFLPLVILGIYKLVFEEKADTSARAWLTFALGYAALIQCHVLSTEVTFAITLVTFVVFLPRLIRRKMILPVMKAVCLVIALCLWYLVPFLDYYLTQDVTIKHVFGRKIQERGVYFANFFILFFKDGANPFLNQTGLKGAQAMGTGLLLTASLLAFYALWISGKQIRLFGKYSAILATVLMVFSTSIFPWDAIQTKYSFLGPFISSIQFSNRFLDWGLVFLVIVTGQVYLYFEPRVKDFQWMASLIVAGAVMCGSLYLVQYVQANANPIQFYNAEGFGTGYISGGEYKIYNASVDKYQYNRFISSDDVEILRTHSGALAAEAIVKNKENTKGWLEVPLAYYKGYEAETTQGKTTVGIGDDAICRVDIPGGYSGEVRIKFVSPWYWRVAEEISCLGYIILIIAIWRSRCQKRRVEK